MSGSNTPAAGEQYWLSNNDYRDVFDGIPTGDRGHLCGTILSAHPPSAVVTAWQWRDSPSYGQGTPFPEQPTIVTARLEQTTRSDGRTRTTVYIDHAGLPIEWLDDMHAVWLCKLEAGASVYRLED